MGAAMSDDDRLLFGPDELQEAARELAERTAAAQGLPVRVTDRAVLERVARIACADDDGEH
jgi:hypothetical protein